MYVDRFAKFCIRSESTLQCLIMSKCLYDILQAEVSFLGRLNHPNLVKLLGFCWEDEELLLVYEFMPRGSLENHLFGSMISLNIGLEKIDSS